MNSTVFPWEGSQIFSYTIHFVFLKITHAVEFLWCNSQRKIHYLGMHLARTCRQFIKARNVTGSWLEEIISFVDALSEILPEGSGDLKTQTDRFFWLLLLNSWFDAFWRWEKCANMQMIIMERTNYSLDYSESIVCFEIGSNISLMLDLPWVPLE